MPASVAIAVAAEVIGTAVAGSALAYSAIVGVSWVTYAGIAQVATAIAGYALSSALSGSRGGGRGDSGSGATASPSSSTFAAAVKGRTQVVRSAVANRTLAYGRVMVSGPLVFAAVETTSANITSPSPDIYNWDGFGTARTLPPGNSTASLLHMVVPLASHEIDAVEEIYFGESKIGTLDASGNITGVLQGFAQVGVHLGTPGDPADTYLVSRGVGWTGNHKLTGIAYLRVSLLFQPDAYPSGIPNIKAVIRGKKVYDPRTGLTVWSQNTALCVNDYLLSAEGLQATAAEVGQVQLVAAANTCDEDITLLDTTTEKRYTCNGVVDLGSTPRSIMDAMLVSMAGNLIWSSGKYLMYAGAYTAPAVTLTSDDLRGPLKVRPRIQRSDLFNGVRGTYVNPQDSWEPSDFPLQKNALYAVQDGVTAGQPIFKDVTLQYTTSSTAAQRLAKLMLERSRQGITVEMPCKLTAFRVAVMDTVRLTFPQMGWDAKDFKVLGWTLAPDGGVDLVLQEESAASYAWNSGMETVDDPAPDTDFPAFDVVQTPGSPTIIESLYETTGSAGVKSRANVSFVSVDPYSLKQKLQWRLLGSAAWNSPSDQNIPKFVLDDMAPGLYEFRAATVNVFQRSSDWSTIVTKELFGLSAAPSDVTGFTITKLGGAAQAAWFLTPDLDVRQGGRIQIRHSQLTSGAQWVDGVILDEFPGAAITGPLPLLTGTYMARFVDSTEHFSTGTASFLASEGMVTGFTTVASTIQDPGFTGAKTNVFLSTTSTIQLTGSVLVDDLVGMMDDLPGLWDSSGGVASNGTYLFDTYMDLGFVATRKFVSKMTVQSFDVANLWDAKTGLVDDMGLWDGADITDCDLTLYAATTDTDPSTSPVWSAWTPFFVSDFTCRAIKFKVVLESGNPEHNINVTALRIDALLPV